jgi:Holliday junction DNA helicase RuvA
LFYYIRGKLVHKTENYVVVDSGGIGYKIYTSNTTLQFFSELDVSATLYTHLHVREDIMDLYGFATMEELSMFEHLIGVSGVGPKAALSILSVTTPAKFAMAVLSGDYKTITKAPGIGPKSAQRVILELKDKLKDVELLPRDDGEAVERSNEHQEAVSALVVLGYSMQEAKQAVSKTNQEDGVEEVIKQALKILMK